MLKYAFYTNVLYIKNRNYYEVVTNMGFDLEKKKQAPNKDLAVIIGEHLAKHGRTTPKDENRSFGRNAFLACVATGAISLGALFGADQIAQYNQNPVAYTNEIIESAYQKAQDIMPTNPITAYLQNNNYE